MAIAVWSCTTHKPETQMTETEPARYRQAGDTLTQIAFDAIRKQLLLKLREGGVPAALTYCQAHALPITDSLSQRYGVNIKRVSNKNRNPLNKANKLESFLIRGYENDLHEKKNPEPRLVLKNDTVLYYKPILTQALCLQCHGTVGQQITEEHAALIQKLYPYDKAINYQLNQVRGLWQISFLQPRSDQPR